MLGGFSMGAVMSYALGLGADRPAPAGILAFSGFIPSVEGWSPALGTAPGAAGVHLPRVARPRDLGRVRPRGRRQLLEAGLPVSYHEFDGAHQIDPRHLPLAGEWLARSIAAAGARESA